MSSLRITRRLALACTGSLLAAASAPATWASPADNPASPVVLTVSGKLKAGRQAVHLDMNALAALPQHSFSTRTPWDERPRQFTGPLLRDVLAFVGAQGDELVAVALNDYKVIIPVSDAERFPVIVARLVDGKPMRVRERGPLFVVYPYDSDTLLLNDRYYARSAWQLRRLEVR